MVFFFPNPPLITILPLENNFLKLLPSSDAMQK